MEFENLIQQPDSLRDQRWEAQFLDGLIPRKVEVEDAEPAPGPDGWPYLRVRAGVAEGSEPFHRIVRWLSGRGIGLVVNPHKMMPDYVFTYGMIWNFVETGRFTAAAPVDGRPTKSAAEFGPGVIFGAPTDKYLPPYVRSVLREFLNAQGFATPKILVATTPDYKQTDLIFSVESLNGVPAAQHATMAEALHWFLPQDYGLVLASERDLPAFVAL